MQSRYPAWCLNIEEGISILEKHTLRNSTVEKDVCHQVSYPRKEADTGIFGSKFYSTYLFFTPDASV